MTTRRDFQERFAFFKETSDKFIEDNLSSDYSIPYFINYFTSLGYFIEKIYDSINSSLFDKFFEIYSEVALALANDRDVNKLLGKNFEAVEEIFTEIFQIESIAKKYTEEPVEIRNLRKKLFRLIKEDKAAEEQKKKENRELLELMERNLNEQNKNILSQVNSIVNKVNETSAEFQGLSRKANEDANKIEDLRRVMEKEIEEIKDRYKPDLANFELHKQEENFLKAADENKRSSYTWRVILVVLLVILVLASFWFIATCWKDRCDIFATYAKQPQEYLRALFYTDLAKNIIIRLFLLSILILLIKYAMKHYNALMHNYTVNTHKASSLNAAMRILDSISNDTTREIVIQTAAKEIFTQEKTGYLTKEDGKLDLDILEKISKLVNKA